MKKNIEPYNVIFWDFNSKTVMPYDIMPYLIDVYLKDKKSRSKNAIHPKTFDEIKQFIINFSRYKFWLRGEYEVIVNSWPLHPKTNEDGTIKMYDFRTFLQKDEVISTIDFYDYKLDIYQQIEMNIDVITKHFISQVS